MYRNVTILLEQWSNLYRFSIHLIEKRPIYSIFRNCCRKKCDLPKNTDFWNENKKNHKKILFVFRRFFIHWHCVITNKYNIYINNTIITMLVYLMILYEYFLNIFICPPICKNHCFSTMWFLFDFHIKKLDKIQ